MYSATQLANINASLKAVVDKANIGDPRHDFRAEVVGDRVRIVEVISVAGATIREVKPRGRRSSSSKGVLEALRSHLLGNDADHSDSVMRQAQGVMRRMRYGNQELFNELQLALARAGI